MGKDEENEGRQPRAIDVMGFAEEETTAQLKRCIAR